MDKVVRIAKKSMPWIDHLLDRQSSVDLFPQKSRGSLCVLCKGGRMLCGKTHCPLLMQLDSLLSVRPHDNNVDGSSPPSVFVGRMGYPHIFMGPLVPPLYGDTSLLDFPEGWMDYSIEEIVQFRMQLVRGKRMTDVHKTEERIVAEMQEAVLSQDPVDIEMKLVRKPSKRILLDSEVQPMGPSGEIETLKISPGSTNKKIEKAAYDTDLKAAEAVCSLHENDVPVSTIQKALSVGLFGLKNRRKLVPTRWSITATDSIVSLSLMERIKRMPVLDEHLVYETTHLDNRFLVILIPEGFRYEAIEAWYPGTFWNPVSNDIFMLGDYEGFKGRTTYAGMGGCYYAARLAVSEHLTNIGRQACVLVLRESHPDYIMPVGVWNVRESVREALRGTPHRFEDMGGVLKFISQKFSIRLPTWVRNSTILEDELYQKRLEEWCH